LIPAFVKYFGCVPMSWPRIWRKARERKEQPETVRMYRYLRHLNMDDVDIREAPVGGYNVVYDNEMREGSNTKNLNGNSTGRHA
jgi:hypothetical protein